MKQDKTESVEKFANRMEQMFRDLGFNRNDTVQVRMLSSAFVDGLKIPIQKALKIARPEYRTVDLETLVLIAKSIEVAPRTNPVMCGPTPTVQLQVGGNPHTFLVDTGAARSVLRLEEIYDPSFLDNITVQCIGIDGEARTSLLTKPLPVSSGLVLSPTVLSQFVVSTTCPLNLLGADLLQKMQANIQFHEDGTITLSSLLQPEETVMLAALQIIQDEISGTAIPSDVMKLIPPHLWSSGPQDIGRLKVQPVVVTLKSGAILPRKPQYPLSVAQIDAVTKQILAFQEKGAIIKTTSPCNTPLFPVKKKGKKGQPDTYRMVQDLRAVNEVTVLETPVVSNPYTLLSCVPPEATRFTVIDLANAFFSVPLHPDSQYLFAFTHAGCQYTWTVMPQGAQNSPSQFSKAMSSILDEWRMEHDTVTLLQYVDDLLLCADTAQTCREASVALLLFLAQQGCKVSLAKVQWCQDKVVFLGHCLSPGAKHLTEDRKTAVMKMTEPTTPKQLQAFLGLISYCRPWILDASILMQPLYDCVPTQPFYLTSEAKQCFELLKQAVISSPALGLPNYNLPFRLYVMERQGYATGVLTQLHGGRSRPLGYYSARLDPVARGSPSCIRAIHACHLLLDKTADVVLGHSLQILAPHDISAILQQTQPKHLSAARHLRMQCSLLLPDTVTIGRCHVLNPASLLPFPQGGTQEGKDDNIDATYSDDEFYHGEAHDCLQLIEQETEPLWNIKETPILDPDLTLFVDGSRYADETGKFHTGYAVTSIETVLQQQPLPPDKSAQEAELTALTEACKMAEGKTANIYTDSRYAFGVAHDFGPIWKSRKFLTAGGTPVKNAEAVQALMEALSLPIQAAILKIKAHSKAETPEAQGNALADKAAKEAAVREMKDLSTIMAFAPGKVARKDGGIPKGFFLTKEILEDRQREATDDEYEVWARKDAGPDEDRIWRLGHLLCLPRSLYPNVVCWAHGPTHLGKTAMNNLISSIWFAPAISTYTSRYVNSCMVCAKCNPGKLEKVPTKCLAKPLYPFQRIQIDHIQMPPAQGFHYALVVVDMFSGWPEAYPVKNQTAKTTVKKLLNEVVCRFGVPEVIESDQGTAFTADIAEEIWTALGTHLAFHTPYRPQSSGKVERMNGTLKLKMLKMAQETGKPWPETLPIALASVRHTPRGKEKLSPFEILFGSVPKLGQYFPEQLALQYDCLADYVIALCKHLTDLHFRVFSSIPDPEQIPGSHKLQPGDWVLVKKHVRKTLEPRFEGPYQVLLTTATSVKLEGKKTWIHASHCKRTTNPDPPPEQ
ncbi:uncharacterized protein LOC122942100 [Bufo gargarizans]|uniref:uncharacterized protein LOC122942100 n=1 Tax=Bufo gargarizans TaxID=30331 RepID=UPI001CF12963|nr:uncharacterized protein LOC122942100 [Bufo gargarizans]